MECRTHQVRHTRRAELQRTSPAARRAQRASGLLVALGLAALLGAAHPAEAQTIKVGSFVKISTTGLQTVPHGLGVPPKALILWTNGKTNESASANFLYAFGMSDGTANYSVAASSLSGGAPTAYRRIASKAITIVRGDGTLIAEADRQPWNATNFVLNWTTNTAATGYVVHFIAIGGSGVSAKVLSWQMNTTTGNQSVTGVGFKPDVVLHAHAGDGVTVLEDAVPPVGQTWAGIGLGAMDAAGGQWASTVLSDTDLATSDTQRGQLTDACLYTISTVLPAPQKRASFVSMDANGFTVNHSVSTTPNATRVVSLALKGVAASAGRFQKTTLSTTPAFVQFAANSAAAANTLTVTLPAPATTGNLLVVSVVFQPRAVSVTQVTDTILIPSNNYRLAVGPTDWGAPFRAYTYYASNITGGFTDVTVDLSGVTTGTFEVYVLEYSGVAGTDPLDLVAGSAGTGTAVSCGGASSTYPSELVYGFIATNNVPTITPTSGLADRSGAFLANFAGDKRVTTLGAQAVTANLSLSPPNWVCQMATFRAGQAVTGLGFRPEGVLLASFQRPAQPDANSVTEARFGIGALDSAFHRTGTTWGRPTCRGSTRRAGPSSRPTTTRPCPRRRPS
jgi:hypothetical protein